MKSCVVKLGKWDEGKYYKLKFLSVFVMVNIMRIEAIKNEIIELYCEYDKTQSSWQFKYRLLYRL